MTLQCPACQTLFRKEAGAESYPCPDCGAEVKPTLDLPSPVGFPAGRRIGNFEIVRRIGVGGMSQVYLARQLPLERQVALKLLATNHLTQDRSLKQFLLEVRNTASLQHPNIITVFEAGTEADLCYLAMQYVEGESLDHRLERDGKLPESEALRIVRTVADALDYAWRKQQLLHRDIKPANLMLDQEKETRILDLGIAQRPSDEFRLASTGIAVGTPHYMSPEQAQGKSDIDFRADIYSLGATLYHLVTGQCPYEGGNAMDVLSKQIMSPLVPPKARNPQLSTPCDSLIRIMMAKHRKDRQADWKAVIEDVDRVLAGTLPKTPTPGLPTPTGPQARQPTPGIVQITQPDARATAGSNDNNDRDSWLPLALLAGALLILAVGMVAAIAFLTGGDDAGEPAPDDAPPVVQQEPDAASPSDNASSQPPADPILTSSQPPAGDSLTDDELRAAIRATLAEGEAAAEVWLPYRRRNDQQTIERLQWMILTEFPGDDGRHALSATQSLAEQYRRHNQLGKLRTLLEQAVYTLASKQPMMASDWIAETADLIGDQESLDEQEQFLWRLLKRNPDDGGLVAGAAAARLVDLYRARGAEAEVVACLSYAIEQLPEKAPFHHEAIRQLQAIDPVAAAEATGEPASADADDPLARAIAELEAERRQTFKPAEQAAITRRIAETFARYGNRAEAISVYHDLIARYGSLGNGLVGGQGLLRQADLYMEAGDSAKALAAWNTLLTRGYVGPDGQLGLKACQQLAAFYSRQGQLEQRNIALRRLAKDFPGPNGDAAAEACFELARFHEDHLEFAECTELLRRIIADFRGENGRHAQRAQRELRRLFAEYPEEMARAAGGGLDPILSGPFKDVIRFDGNRDYLELRERTTRLSLTRAMTLEAWILVEQQAPYEQFIASRFGNNQRGFNLFLMDGKLHWDVYDGERQHRLVAPEALPERTWVHVAATAATGKLEIFVNGRGVASSSLTRPENDGAGRLRIGRASWMRQGYFAGAMQYVRVHTRVVYRDDFTPAVKPEFDAEIFAFIYAEGGRVRDRAGNRLIEPRH